VRRSRQGLTLIEVQVAILVLFVAILAAVALAPIGMSGVQLAERNAHAMNYARHIMEATIALPYNRQIGMSLRPLTATIIPGVQPGYSCETLISNLPGPNLHQIEVNIYWTDASAAHQSMTRAYRLVAYSAKAD